MHEASARLQGTLELLILKTLERSTNHGFGITLHIQTVSEGLLRVEEGSLYPALHRLEHQGFITSEWGESENRRKAKFYRLTPAGRRRLKDEQAYWMRFAAAVGLALSASPEDV